MDSGSMLSVIPAKPLDMENILSTATAANRTRLRTYGRRKVQIQFGRKTYPFLAVVTKVAKQSSEQTSSRHTASQSVTQKKCFLEIMSHDCKAETVQHGVVHKIDTGNATPCCKAPRPLDRGP